MHRPKFIPEVAAVHWLCLERKSQHDCYNLPRSTTSHPVIPYGMQIQFWIWKYFTVAKTLWWNYYFSYNPENADIVIFKIRMLKGKLTGGHQSRRRHHHLRSSAVNDWLPQCRNAPNLRHHSWPKNIVHTAILFFFIFNEIKSEFLNILVKKFRLMIS